ncbi:MAG: hypothetical protein E7371_04995 [Clostridiales bacterium]|nr:hypothetical protein [Clostridiales bacterium]
MRKKISCILAATLTLSSVAFAGCKKNKTSNEYDTVYPDRVVNTYSFDIIGGKDVMPVGLYFGPYTPNSSKNGNTLPNFTDEYYIKMIADAGINLFTYCPESYPQARESIKKVLTLAEKYNIGYYVNDYAVTSMTHGYSALNEDKIKEQVAEFAGYKSFVGFYSKDEPYYEQIEYIGKVNKVINEEFDNKYSTYVNMLPRWEERPLKYTSGTEDIEYEEYVGRYFREGNGKYISWDHYVWDFKSYKGYFNNLAIIKSMAEDYGIPYWAFIQAGGQWNDAGIEFESLPEAYPTEGQLIWNVNTSLACGAKGIQYFLGFQPLHFAYAPNGTYDFTRNSLFGSVGNVNEWYYYAQKMNVQIEAVDEILMNAYNVGILPSDSIKAEFEGNSMVIEGNEFHQLKGIRGDALVGCFEYEKRTVLYVVNYQHTGAQDVVLDLNDAQEMKIIQRGKTSTMNTKHLGIHLEAGEAVLVEFM